MFISRSRVPVWQPPRTLFNVDTAGSTRSKLLWPGGAYTATLPEVGSGAIASLTDGTDAVGAVFAPDSAWSSVLLDFAGEGAADQTLIVEIGKFAGSGILTVPLASVSLKTITSSGTTDADINPFTGEATASTTWRLVDLVTKTDYGALAQVVINTNGGENDRPSQLLLDTSEAPYYYVLVTSLGALTKALAALTPQY